MQPRSHETVEGPCRTYFGFTLVPTCSNTDPIYRFQLLYHQIKSSQPNNIYRSMIPKKCSWELGIYMYYLAQGKELQKMFLEHGSFEQLEIRIQKKHIESQSKTKAGGWYTKGQLENQHGWTKTRTQFFDRNMVRI